MGTAPGEPAAWPAWTHDLVSYLTAPLQLGGVGSRFHASAFVVFLAVAVVIFVREKRGRGSLLQHLFPREIYFTQSSLVDLKVYVARHFVSLSAIGMRLVSATAIAAFVAGLILGNTPLDAGAPLTGWRWVACFLAVALAFDVAGYWLHRASHEWGALWPFHAVHHSAEGLTPLTVARVHPVYEFLGTLFVPVVVGPVLGVIFALFGERSFSGAAAVTTSYTLFYLAGSNLRHSHFWIGYGPVVSRVFVSPAMHQIHHSVEDRHWNKNYGEIFALWDWAFGTLYVPQTRESFDIGVGRDEHGRIAQPHPTLRAAFLGPFAESGRAIAAFGRRVARRGDDGRAEAAP